MFPRDVVCLRNISVDTLHKGDTEDDDDDDDDDDNNNNINVLLPTDAQENCFKRSIKIYIKTAPTCFGVITIISEFTI